MAFGWGCEVSARRRRGAADRSMKKSSCCIVSVDGKASLQSICAEDNDFSGSVKLGQGVAGCVACFVRFRVLRHVFIDCRGEFYEKGLFCKRKSFFL
jgi:hypothetical protein